MIAHPKHIRMIGKNTNCVLFLLLMLYVQLTYNENEWVLFFLLCRFGVVGVRANTIYSNSWSPFQWAMIYGLLLLKLLQPILFTVNDLCSSIVHRKLFVRLPVRLLSFMSEQTYRTAKKMIWFACYSNHSFQNCHDIHFDIHIEVLALTDCYRAIFACLRHLKNDMQILHVAWSFVAYSGELCTTICMFNWIRRYGNRHLFPLRILYKLSRRSIAWAWIIISFMGTYYFERY